MSSSSLADRRDNVFGVGAPLFYKEPLHIVRGEGVTLYDEAGKQYIDMYNNVPCVGHANPHVVEAMHKQASTLNVHSRYLHEGVVEFAERLVAKHRSPDLSRVVFSCTGSEANEVAIKMARLATGGKGLICTDRAYHGNTDLVGTLTYAGMREQTNVRPVVFPQKYRPIEEGLSEEALADRYVVEVERAIESFKDAGVPLAAMLVCSVCANEGVPDIPKGYMKRAADLVRAAGGVMISDEVQAGYCRTGDWWGYETSDFVPDIVTTGKPMGNGVPLSATVTSKEIADTFRKKSRYFNTFASSPLQAAAGSAVLNVIESEGLLGQVDDVGEHLRNELKKFEHPSIGDVRGPGLFVGIDWVLNRDIKEPDAEGAAEMANRLKDKGFLINHAGAHSNILKLRPPLVFTRDHADQFLAAFAETLEDIS